MNILNSADTSLSNVQKIIENQDMSVKNRNIVLRSIIVAVEHGATLNDEEQQALEILFSSVSNMDGCEKYFDEAITVLQKQGNSYQKKMVEEFYQKVSLR